MAVVRENGGAPVDLRSALNRMLFAVPVLLIVLVKYANEDRFSLRRELTTEVISPLC